MRRSLIALLAVATASVGSARASNTLTFLEGAAMVATQLEQATARVKKRYPGIEPALRAIKDGQNTGEHYKNVVLASDALLGTPGLRDAIVEIANIERGEPAIGGRRHYTASEKATRTAGLTFQLTSLALYPGQVSHISFQEFFLGDIDAVMNGDTRVEIKRLSADASMRKKQLTQAALQIVVRQQADPRLRGERPNVVFLTNYALTPADRAFLFAEAKRLDRHGRGISKKRLKLVSVRQRLKQLARQKKPVPRSLAAMHRALSRTPATSRIRKSPRLLRSTNGRNNARRGKGRTRSRGR